MLDKNSENILKIINDTAPEGFKIFNCDDFLNCEVHKGILDLAEKNYVNLKYSNDGEYLLSLTASGRQYFKKKQEEYTFKQDLFKKVSVFSFLGAFFGCLIIQLLLLLLGVYHG